MRSGKQRRAEAPAQHERAGNQRADDAADADRRVEQAGPGLADLEDVDREDDGDHAQAAEHEAVGDVDHGQPGQRAA